MTDLPYTISYVIRKRQQIDSFNEVDKEKRPPEKLIWDGNSDEIEEWFDRIFKRKEKTESGIVINIDGIEE